VVRTQIQLTEAQAAGLKRAAAERGVSMAALIREAVDGLVSGPDPADTRRRARAAIGAFSSGLGGAAANHEEYLAQAIADDVLGD
jgi:hypothetical protein